MVWIVGALESAALVGGVNAFGAALYSVGIPKDSILKYETSLKSDKFLLIAHGTREEVEKAKKILETTNCVESSLHCA